MVGTFILSICMTASGRYKVYVCGSADEHLMDWAGLNLRYTPVSGQPRLGFNTFEEAEGLQQRIEADKDWQDREYREARATGGSYIPTERYVSRCACEGCNRVKTGEFLFCQDNCAPPYGTRRCAKHEQVGVRGGAR